MKKGIHQKQAIEIFLVRAAKRVTKTAFLMIANKKGKRGGFIILKEWTGEQNHTFVRILPSHIAVIIVMLAHS